MRSFTQPAKTPGLRAWFGRAVWATPQQQAPAYALIFFLATAGLALGSTAAYSQPAPGYVLNPGDRLSYTVEEDPNLSANYVLVNQDGTIALPNNAGVLRVAGRTAEEVRAALKTRLERDLKSATVAVTIETTRGSTVRLLGAVQGPGERKIDAATTIFELLTRNNELSGPNAGVAQVRRRSTALGLGEQIDIPLPALLQEFDPRFNLPLQDGDIITIPPGVAITVHFVGEVNQQIEFLPAEPKTLIRAIAKVGGLTERASNKIQITRTLPDGTQQTLEAKYKRILSGRDPDILLQANDLILIKKSII